MQSWPTFLLVCFMITWKQCDVNRTLDLAGKTFGAAAKMGRTKSRQPLDFGQHSAGNAYTSAVSNVREKVRPCGLMTLGYD